MPRLIKQISGVYEMELPLYGKVRILRDSQGWWVRRSGWVIAEGKTLREVVEQLRATVED